MVTSGWLAAVLEADWPAGRPAALARLQNEHHDIARLLRVLERQLAVLREGGWPRYDLLRSALHYFANFPDLVHHPKEDRVFARLAERAPSLSAAVADMVAEHDRLGDATRGFETLLERDHVDDPDWRDAVTQSLDAYIDFYWRHMATEEGTLLPRAREVLSEADWEEVDAVIDPVFGEAVAEQYARLCEEILREGA
jgi:hemerythrin-like domain-containing protein